MKNTKTILILLTVITLSGALISSVSIFARRNSRSQESSTGRGQSIKSKGESNGTKLLLKYQCLDEGVPDPVQFLPLPSGSMLAGVCNTLYMLDTQRKVVWEYPVPQMLFDFTFIEATGLVYGTAGDNTMFILEASSGKELVFESRNGRAAYGVVKAYGSDQCLVTDYYGGYRENNPNPKTIPLTPDGITAWRGTKVLWHADFPADAELVVNGNKILAVSKTKDGIFVKEIEVPRGKN
jgi:hypothetical protein